MVRDQCLSKWTISYHIRVFKPSIFLFLSPENHIQVHYIFFITNLLASVCNDGKMYSTTSKTDSSKCLYCLPG
jgi:hypothetical protein